MIVSTEAIVLRSMKYRETSKIVTLYSRRYGKISVLAKGARAAGNKYGASLEPMTHSSIILYKKEHRDLQLLSKSEIVKPFMRLHSDGEKMAVGLALIELVNMVMHDEEENEPMFTLLSEALDAVDRARKDTMNVLFAFELRLLRLFGFGLSVDECSVCRKRLHDDPSTKFAHVVLSSGAVICDECSITDKRGGIKISKGVLHSLIYLAAAPLDRVTNLRLAGSQDEVRSILHTYMHYHIEETRTLRSLSLFNST